MSSSRTVWLVMIGGLLASAAGLYYYISIYRPREVVATEAKAVDDWAARWVTARTCLLGEVPAAAGGVDGVVAGEMLDGFHDGCVRAFGDLERPGTTSSSNRAIENAWSALRSATIKIANAYALRYADDTSTLASVRRKSLGEAVDAVDEAHAALRKSVGRKPFEVPAPRFALATAVERAALALGGVPILADDVSVDPGREQIRLWAGRGERDAAMISVDAGERVFADVDGKPTRGGTGAAWGVWVETDDAGNPVLRSDPLDERGEPVLGADDKVGVVQRGKSGDVLTVRGALGKGTGRLAVYQWVRLTGGVSLQLAVSTDDGATWTATPLLADATALNELTFDPLTPRIDLIAERDDRTEWLVLDGDSIGRPPAWAPVPVTRDLGHCISGGSMAWISDERLTFAHRDGSPPGITAIDEVDGTLLLDCDGDVALLRPTPDYEPTATLALSLCDPAACRRLPAARLPEDYAYAGAVLAGARPLSVVVADGVVLVRQPDAADDAPPLALVRIPDNRALLGVVTWNGALLAVLQATAGEPRVTVAELARP